MHSPTTEQARNSNPSFFVHAASPAAAPARASTLARHSSASCAKPNNITVPSEEGEYTMTVFSTLDDAVACSLTNDPPLAQGPHSTVTVECSEPVADASTDTAVVVVTGPKR